MNKKNEYMVLSDFLARTPSGDKQFYAGQVIRIPEESALQLLELGKIKTFENRKRKSVAVEDKQEPISLEVLNAIFTEASEKLSLIYKGGEYEYARIHYPELYQAERDALKRVDALWFDALAGKVSFETFKQAVNRWHECVMSLMNANKTNVNVKGGVNGNN